MDIKQLHYFLLLCQQEHISGTADLLGISQPALSKSIASLEKELGTQLFDRRSNSIRLNSYGRNFAVYAQEAVEKLEQGFSHLRQTRYDTLGEIRIVCHAFADCIAGCLLAYTELNPRIKITVGQSEVHDEKLAENADFVLAPQSDTLLAGTHQNSWISLPLFTEQHCVLISPRYREYPEEVTELSMEELRDDLFIEMPLVTLFYRDITHRLCHAAGFSPKIFCSTEDFLTKITLVDAGRAICILPESNLRIARKLSPDIRTFFIKEMDTARSLYLLARQEALKTEVVADFWEFAQDYYQEKKIPHGGRHLSVRPL